MVEIPDVVCGGSARTGAVEQAVGHRAQGAGAPRPIHQLSFIDMESDSTRASPASGRFLILLAAAPRHLRLLHGLQPAELRGDAGPVGSGVQWAPRHDARRAAVDAVIRRLTDDVSFAEWQASDGDAVRPALSRAGFAFTHAAPPGATPWQRGFGDGET